MKKTYSIIIMDDYDENEFWSYKGFDECFKSIAETCNEDPEFACGTKTLIFKINDKEVKYPQ